MKKKRIISLVFLLMIVCIVLCSCTQTQKHYTIEKNGVIFEVNKETNTISDGNYTYIYSFEGNNSDYKVDITYPDGSTYWWDMKGYGGSGGWSDNYDPQKYIDGDVLTNVLLEDAPKAPKHSGGNIIAKGTPEEVSSVTSTALATIATLKSITKANAKEIILLNFIIITSKIDN